MALADELEVINNVLTFLVRVNNLEGQGVISGTMAIVMRQKAIEYLETVFPPPP